MLGKRRWGGGRRSHVGPQRSPSRCQRTGTVAASWVAHAACASLPGQLPSAFTVPGQAKATGGELKLPFPVTDERPELSVLAIVSSASRLVSSASFTVLGNGTNRAIHARPAAGGTANDTLVTVVHDVHDLRTADTFDAEPLDYLGMSVADD